MQFTNYFKASKKYFGIFYLPFEKQHYELLGGVEEALRQKSYFYLLFDTSILGM